jgi:hypothetical protein
VDRQRGYPEMAAVAANKSGFLRASHCVAPISIAIFTIFGETSVERLFKWVSIFVYAIYAVLLVLALTKFGDRIANFGLDRQRQRYDSTIRLSGEV